MTELALVLLSAVAHAGWNFIAKRASGGPVFNWLFDALSVSPVSYVAPVREIGILLGAMMGSRWLAEGNARQRLAGAVTMVAGVVALAVG